MNPYLYDNLPSPRQAVTRAGFLAIASLATAQSFVTDDTAVFIVFGSAGDAARFLDCDDRTLELIRANLGWGASRLVPMVAAETAFKRVDPRNTGTLLYNDLVAGLPVPVDLALRTAPSWIWSARMLLTVLRPEGWDRYGSQLSGWTIQSLLRRAKGFGPARISVATAGLDVAPSQYLGTLTPAQRVGLSEGIESLFATAPVTRAAVTSVEVV